MAWEVIFQLGCQPVAGGRNLQGSLCLGTFHMDLVAGNMPCLFSRSQHNLYPLPSGKV